VLPNGIHIGKRYQLPQWKHAEKYAETIMAIAVCRTDPMPKIQVFAPFETFEHMQKPAYFLKNRGFFCIIG
jgi:hypothetical protein